MEKKPISRKAFLSNSTKIIGGGIAGVAGLNLLANGQLKAETVKTTATWPFPYAILDAEAARDKAHYLFWNGKDCAAGVFGSLISLLTDAIGDPWTNIPQEIMLFGRGGGVGWGSLCGTLNGSAAIISMVTPKADSTDLVNEIWGWYSTEQLPTDAANAATYTVQNYVGPLPQSTSGSVLCHPSVSQWCLVADKEVGSTERKERCGRLAGDIAAKTVEILNEYFQSTFVPTFQNSDGVAGCLTCHNTNTMTHMECVSCHTTAHNQPSLAESMSGGAVGYSLGNAYPNPFNSYTTIQFSIPDKEKVRLEVYDLKGRLVNSLIDSEFMDKGSYKMEWNGTNNQGERVPTGIYIVRLTTGKYMKSIKLNVAK